MNRGRRREEIYIDKGDYIAFIEFLHEASEVFSVCFAAYCLMSNHVYVELNIMHEITVGMPITRHPPYRSQRALLMHWAPASSIDAHALQWIRVTDKRDRQPPLGYPAHPFPCYTMFLTSATQ